MDTEMIETFLRIVRSESFTRAAIDLHLTQPTVSSRIKRLEAEVGATLLSRGGGKVLLTPEGQAFKPIAEELLRLADEARGIVAMTARDDGLRRLLRLGMNHTSTAAVSPIVLPAFLAQGGGRRATLESAGTASLMHMLSEQAIELAFVSTELAHPLADRILTISSRLVLACRTEAYPWPKGDSAWMLPPAALRELPVSALSIGPSRRSIDELAALVGSPLNIVMLSNSVSVVRDTVLRGNCIGLLPAQAVHEELKSGIVREVPIRDYTEQISEASLARWRGARLSPVANEFVQFVREHLEPWVRT